MTPTVPRSPESSGARLWVEISTPHDVVATGLQTIIDAELGAKVFTTVGPVDGEPDVVLYDVIGLHEGGGETWTTGSRRRRRRSSPSRPNCGPTSARWRSSAAPRPPS